MNGDENFSKIGENSVTWLHICIEEEKIRNDLNSVFAFSEATKSNGRISSLIISKTNQVIEFDG